MASLNMSPEELKQLELLRNRFAQLTSSLTSLRASVMTTNPLPSRESLQASATILQQNIRSLQELATENAGMFQRLAIHPSTNFPGRTHEHILAQLLRKKLEPDVESWVEEARATARAAGLDASQLAAGVRKRGEHDYDDEDTYGMGQDDDGDDAPSDPFSEQWAEMQDCFQQTLQQYVTVQVKKKYTVEEQAMGVENVRTGLRQTLEESDDEEDEDEDEDEEEEEEEATAAAGGAGAPAAGAGGPGAAGGKMAVMIAPEHIFYLQATGNLNLPKNVPIESKRIQTGPTRRVAPPR
ncbi:mediator of RNA polymerase II transcription complex subunit 8-domain-containing protein [Parachaetomium inaequale]|uniref:Mediator of RNA polymerase II transcription subunit 8 n=1 Tax=Parachaetomium inaequale TaxID=2588326 RepID=A0AAN6PPH6_9PEZI|nr:mediator of RNA polymerase II transcription complex subunit 8-domain-containing protein [Parachaetomium inaequale]